MILIKKYSNRRLYDTEKKCYITLEELAQLIRDGQEIKVLDNDTQKDITQETLGQIIFQTLSNLFPASTLHQLIRMQQDQLHEFFRVYLTSGLDYFSNLKKQMSQQVDLWNKFWMATLQPFSSVKTISEADVIELKRKLEIYQKKIRELEEELKKSFIKSTTP